MAAMTVRPGSDAVLFMSRTSKFEFGPTQIIKRTPDSDVELN